MAAKTLLAAISLCASAAICPAGITALENFDTLAPGNLAGRGADDSGWAGVWATGLASGVTATVATAPVDFTPMGANAVGGRNSLTIAGSATGVPATRQLATPRTGTFYLGCLMKFGGVLNTDDIYTVGLGANAADTGNGFNFGFRGVAAGAAHYYFIRKGTGTPPAGPLLSDSGAITDTRYIVLKIEKTGGGNYNKVIGWINPYTMSEAMNPGGDLSLAADLGTASLSHVILRASGVDGGDNCGIDHLALGTDFADVVRPWFGIFPLYGVYSGSAGSLTEAQAQAAVGDLKSQIGENRGGFRVGFGGIFGNEATLDRNCRLARDNNLSHSVIIGTQTHALPTSVAAIAAADFRNYQWRRDGSTWEGVNPADNRDWQVVTPSRYATAIRGEFERIVRDTRAKPVKRQMDKYPGVLVSVNACIEEELAIGNGNSNYIGDYSPYAITEFRDWLRHTGIYDADSGTYPGEGAPAAIVGNYVNIGGKMRSPFYDDPGPGNANGTGPTFNSKFGTAFTTWTLRNWDLTAWPAAITNPGFDPTPSSGTGYTAGGFDAPRTISPGSAWWRAWSWDTQDQGDAYPPGNPAAPAFGFRQTLVRNFVNDELAWIAAEGIPANIITAHQIPAEMLFSQNRALSSASPIWTGLSKQNGSVGITRYGTFNSTTLGYITQYTDFWSVHEWHPRPNETDDNVLRTYAMSEIEKMYNNKCRLVCPFSWTGNAPYPVRDSGIATGLKDWMDGKIVAQTPTLTAIPDRNSAAGQPTAALPFTVGDDEIPAGAIVVSAASSNPALVPESNIAITGSGANRSVIVTPTGGGTGSATISLTASDGSLQITKSFTISFIGNQPPTVSSIADRSVPENGSALVAFEIGDDNTPAAALTVTATSSNPPLIPPGNLILGGGGANRTLAISPAGGQLGSAVVTITVSDGALSTSREFTLAVVRTIFGNASDASVKDDGGVVDAANPTTLLGAGGSSPYVDRCTVYVFQLPDLGPLANPFTDSSFLFDFPAKQNALADNDLYGLGTRVTPAVQSGDYYGQTAAHDPTDADFLQSAIVTNSTPTGPVATSPEGKSNLLAYLNTQYAAGAGAGRYVFLRLNTTAPKTGISRATLTMAEGGAAGPPDTRPRIEFTFNTPPLLGPIADLTLPANASSGAISFTAGDSQTPAAALTAGASSSDPALLPAAGIVLGGTGGARTISISPAANRLGSATVFVTLSDGVNVASRSFLVTITGTVAETWRFANFDTTANSGPAADAADPDGDGEINLLEFATGQDPHGATLATTTLVRAGANLDFTYNRNAAAAAGGVSFQVQWSDTLALGSWSGTGVAEEILSTSGGLQSVRATIPGGGDTRFARLRVAAP